MAHTLSREKAQRRLLAEPLTAWRDWLVCARCLAGHLASPQPMDGLLAMPRPPETLGRLLNRMRCH
ncbi:MAG TPA: hypothetical protein VNZ61_20975 [Roseomonas sp.]|nr:hypothetical protein [Roseomonas sp.]